MKRMLVNGVVAIAAATLVSSAQCAQVGYDTLIAHRGESNDAPENTLPAYRMAVERGFGFECDVYLSKDGRVFTFHDSDLKRTTAGANTNRCSDVTWDEISRLDVGGWGKWKGSRFEGTRPALLEEVLALARDGRMIYVEVKPGPAIVPYIKKVFASQKNATPRNALFISFNKETCKALKEQMGEYKVYWLTSSRHKKTPGRPPITTKYVLDMMRETGADGVDCHYAPDIVTAEMVAEVQKAGYEFHVWTVDKLEDTEEAFARGVKTVTTNCAEAQFKAAKAKRASQTVFRGVMSPAQNMTEDDFKTLKSWGATLLRYQMVRNWHGVNGNRDLDEFTNWLNGRLDHFDTFVLPMAVKHGLKVVLDLHVPPGGRNAKSEHNMFYDRKYADYFVATWRRIAHRFRGRDGIYGYDLINEPCHKHAPTSGLDCWNLQRMAAEAIRDEDPDVPIVVESNEWDAPAAFAAMKPLAISNVIYQVHMYEPFEYTHQRVLGTRPWTVGWPNAEKGWDRAFLEKTLKPVRDFQLKYGARIFVGEFSAVCWAPGAGKYLEDCISLFEEYGWDWTYHAFREWPGWSVEHEGEDGKSLRPSCDNPRKRALLDAMNLL